MIYIFALCLLVSGYNTVQAAEKQCPDKVRVCYYTSWSFYRSDEGKFQIGDINTTLCTHIVYAFAGINIHGGIASLDEGYDVGQGGYQYFTSLKNDNPCLKVLLAVGGWNEGSLKYSVAAYSEGSRAAFADSVVRFLAAYNFDGLDLDWEYPAQRGGIADDKRNYILLLEALHQRFKPWGFMLTAAVPIGDTALLQSYDIPAMARVLDYVSLMAYDYTSSASSHTGFISPLPSINSSVQFWLNNGMPKDKLVLGLATYATTFKLADPSKHGVGASSAGPGDEGEYTRTKGFLSFYELLTKLYSDQYEIVLDKNVRNYYAYFEDEWMTFDLLDTYEAKILYALNMDLKGMMLWTLDTDDFLGIYNKNFTILQTVYDYMKANGHV